MRPSQIIKYIRAHIPVFQCKSGCHDCCHDLIGWSKYEWDQIKDKRIATSLTCPYLGECGCEIYEQRPVICRLYGTIRNPMLRCKHGYGPQNPLSRTKESRLFAMYCALINDDMEITLSRAADLSKIIPLIEAGAECTDAMKRLALRIKGKLVNAE